MRKLGVVLLALVALTGCETLTEEKQATYYDAAAMVGFEKADADALRVAVCDGEHEEVQRLVGTLDDGFARRNANVVIEAARDAFCPTLR